MTAARREGSDLPFPGSRSARHIRLPGRPPALPSSTTLPVCPGSPQKKSSPAQGRAPILHGSPCPSGSPAKTTSPQKRREPPACTPHRCREPLRGKAGHAPACTQCRTRALFPPLLPGFSHKKTRDGKPSRVSCSSGRDAVPRGIRTCIQSAEQHASRRQTSGCRGRERPRYRSLR